MSRLKKLKTKLINREPILSTTISNISWSGLVQKAAEFSFDFIIFDLEHGTLSTETIEESLRICRLTDLPTVVRVPDSTPSYISKILDMGADGILLPRIESIEQVETAIRSAKYFPRGRKGCGGFSNFREEDELSVDKYNDNRMIFIQMESEEGLNVLPDILSNHSDEIDGIIIGPYDASIMLGTPLDISSDIMVDYIKNVFSICKEYDMSTGIFLEQESMIENYRDMGANIFWVGTEISLISQAYNELCTSYDKVFASYKALSK